MCSAGHWRKKGAERVDANAKVLARRDFELIGENSLKTKTKKFQKQNCSVFVTKLIYLEMEPESVGVIFSN